MQRNKTHDIMLKPGDLVLLDNRVYGLVINNDINRSNLPVIADISICCQFRWSSKLDVVIQCLC